MLEQIRKNNKKYHEELRKFVLLLEKLGGIISVKEFADFLLIFKNKEGLDQQDIFTMTSIMDEDKSGKIDGNAFIAAYNSYLLFEEKVRQRFVDSIG